MSTTAGSTAVVNAAMLGLLALVLDPACAPEPFDPVEVDAGPPALAGVSDLKSPIIPAAPATMITATTAAATWGPSRRRLLSP
jgi:hypothetical protein